MPRLRKPSDEVREDAITTMFKHALVEKHWSQEHLGKLCGMEQSYINRIINEPSKRQLGHVLKVADKLGINLLSDEALNKYKA